MHYVILPYTVTSRPLAIRGVKFHRSDDLEGLGAEETEHLQSLFKLFYLKEDLRLKRMSYSVLPEVEPGKWLAFSRRLWECSTSLRYLCTRPNPHTTRPATLGGPGGFPAVEIADMFVFHYCNVTTAHFLPQHMLENVEYTGTEPQNSFQRILDGFEGWMIGRGNTFTIGKSGKIYPPHFAFDSHTAFRYPIDIAAIVDELTHGSKWALKQFVTSQSDELSPLEKRIFKAMDWFNQSCEYGINPYRSLVFLAIAFEALLNLKWEAKNTDRFKDVVMVLLGSVERLDSWLELFFAARGAIVHTGEARDIVYYPPTGDRKYNRDMPISLLSDQGQTIFHLCLDAILSSSVTADEARLHSKFRHDEERIQEIFSIIGRKDGGTPAERILSARDAVMELLRNNHIPASRAKPVSVLNVTGKMIDLYLSGASHESLGIPADIVSRMKVFVSEMKQFDAAKSPPKPQIEKLDMIIAEIDDWHSEALGIDIPRRDDTFDVLLLLLHYAAVYFRDTVLQWSVPTPPSSG